MTVKNGETVCIKGFRPFECRYTAHLGCDCGFHKALKQPTEKWTEHKGRPDFAGFVVTNPAHGGKVDCAKCSKWIYEEQAHRTIEGTLKGYTLYLHEACFNPYEHYYGYNKPID